MQDFTLIYDGSCPVCNVYVRHVRIKEAIPAFQMIDARKAIDQVAQLSAQGIDINKGMVLIAGETIYSGSDCIHMLALLSSKSGLFNKINAALFSRRQFAKWLYPIMRLGRTLLLKLLRLPLIDVPAK